MSILTAVSGQSVYRGYEYYEAKKVQRMDQETAEQLIAYVRKMKKSEAQEALLQLLFDGPEWQYERFAAEHLGEW